MTEKLYEATKLLLANYPREVTLAAIAKGAGVKPGWLSAFSRNAIPDPGVIKVQKLHDYLTKPRG